MKKLPLHWKILLGMLFGVLFGLLFSQFEWGRDLVVDWIKPFGTIFINVLKLIAVPLILASLIKGVSDLKDITQLSSMGSRTIGLYLLTTLTAVTIGLSIVNLIKPGNTISDETRKELLSAYASDAAAKQTVAAAQKEAGPLQALVDMVPSNIFAAMQDNGNMLQVIFFAIFFGIGIVLIPQKKSQSVKDFFDALNEVILKLIDLIMIAAPYGVFALLAALVAEAPSADLFKALGLYTITVLLGLLCMLFFYIILVRLVTGKKIGFFLKGISPAQLLAFSTSSSAATLPVTMERVHEHLGVEEDLSLIHI